MAKLTTRKVATAGAGKYGDGGGLQLVVSASGARKWSFRYMVDGKAREMGLGSYPAVTLAEARDLRDAARRTLAAGGAPIEDRKRAAQALAAIPTFGAFAAQVAGELAKGFRNEKHAAQWTATLATYCAPMAYKRIDRIETADVLECLSPIWQAKPETASRVRGRIEKVLSAAKARGLRTGENPAAWRGHLDNLLARPARLARGHHAALPYAGLPAFMAALREREGVAARALEFVILTAARSGEARGATWGEIDLQAKVWTVPADRMKGGREHRVPLSARAVAIVEALRPLASGADALVFPGLRGKPQSDMTLAAVLKRMGVEATVHGFRSAFRDWAGNETAFAREIAEAALAHVVGDATERAYRRSDALERRRGLMDAWAQWCEPAKAANVTPLRRRKSAGDPAG